MVETTEFECSRHNCIFVGCLCPFFDYGSRHGGNFKVDESLWSSELEFIRMQILFRWLGSSRYKILFSKFELTSLVWFKDTRVQTPLRTRLVFGDEHVVKATDNKQMAGTTRLHRGSNFVWWYLSVQGDVYRPVPWKRRCEFVCVSGVGIDWLSYLAI